MKAIFRTFAIGALVICGSSSAFAAFPASVLGTWNAILNQTVTTIEITSEGTGKCRPISGTISTTNIQGFYCRATGRIVFVRKNQSTNDTSQIYSGNLATDGATDRMGGTFADINSNGEFGWSASR